ncbi:hypothetical protein [Janthinobacterium agaricidamnosum]|uniref:hypothetical protein n=1 Tax=Janthinobacterium agaricidamnosum TaxID=55508 RepID=UPI00118645EF|nr:hypothetical protein [Janthinobacterium agaricidamnosum]
MSDPLKTPFAFINIDALPAVAELYGGIACTVSTPIQRVLKTAFRTGCMGVDCSKLRMRVLKFFAANSYARNSYFLSPPVAGIE